MKNSLINKSIWTWTENCIGFFDTDWLSKFFPFSLEKKKKKVERVNVLCDKYVTEIAQRDVHFRTSIVAIERERELTNDDIDHCSDHLFVDLSLHLLRKENIWIHLFNVKQMDQWTSDSNYKMIRSFFLLIFVSDRIDELLHDESM